MEEPLRSVNPKLHRSVAVRYILLSLGWCFVLLGALGAALPLLPTTPFILLAAFCFARGSVKAHAWLLENRVFGPLLRDWERGGAISPSAKCLAATMLLAMAGYQVFFGEKPPGVRIAIGSVAVCVLAFILSRPSHPIAGSIRRQAPGPPDFAPGDDCQGDRGQGNREV